MRRSFALVLLTCAILTSSYAQRMMDSVRSTYLKMKMPTGTVRETNTDLITRTTALLDSFTISKDYSLNNNKAEVFYLIRGLVPTDTISGGVRGLVPTDTFLRGVRGLVPTDTSLRGVFDSLGARLNLNNYTLSNFSGTDFYAIKKDSLTYLAVIKPVGQETMVSMKPLTVSNSSQSIKACSSTSSSISPATCKTYTSPSKKYTWTKSGTYTDIISNKAGCDSIITVNLNITGKADTSVTVKGNTLTANAKNATYQWIDCKTNEPININTRSLIATVNGSYKVSIDQDGCTGVSSCYTVNPSPPIDKKPIDSSVTTTPESYSRLKEFVEINKLVPKDREGYENFGYSVGISGDYAVIGANVDDKDANGENPISDAGSAYIFKKQKDGKWKEVQKIVASDRGDGDNFGWAVAINNNHIVVGAIYQDKDLSGTNQSSTGSGAVYVFERNDDGLWVQKQKIIPNPLDGQTLFGHSVAIDGNTIAVGSPWYAKDASGKPETNLNDAGAVFVFNKTGGAWVQSQILTPSIRNINNLGDGLGWSVSVCGDLIIAGAWGVDFDEKGEGTRMEASGAAYIFERSGGKWKEVQKIVARDRAAHDQFGYSVAISGDNAIIGAWNKTETDDPNSRPFTGNAYMFSRKAAPNRVLNDGRVILAPESDGKWRQVLKINPEDRRPDDYLGWSVAMSGDYAIVSAMKQDTDSLNNLIDDGGAIYVFYQDKNGKWSQTGKLATFDRSQLDNFGHAVAISGCDIIGGTIVDQEDDHDANALTSAGSAYVFSAADCRNVAPCYQPKVTPDIKTPRDKTGQPDNIDNNINPATNNKVKNTKPEKIQASDLDAKGNETTINNVDLIKDGIKAAQDTNAIKQKPVLPGKKRNN